MKQFVVRVKVEWENALDAESKQQAVERVKEIFSNQHKMTLHDSEIISVEEDKFVECPYCGNRSDSIDPRILCKECRQDFGHVFVDEL